MMMKRKLLLALILVFSLSSGTLLASDLAHPPQAGPTLLKYSVQVTADRLVRYWKAPESDNYWSWLPRVNFLVLGPSMTGTVYSVDFANPDGSAWYSVDCASETIAAGHGCTSRRTRAI